MEEERRKRALAYGADNHLIDDRFQVCKHLSIHSHPQAIAQHKGSKYTI